MGIETRVYRLNDDLAVNIPEAVLPPSSIQLVEERVETPGFEAETTSWVPLLTGRRAKDGRLAIHVPFDVMDGLGFDPDKELGVRLYGYRTWLRSHIHHRWPYGAVRDRRVWISSKLVDRLRIHDYEYYPVIIRGTTLPRVEIRMVPREVRNVVVDHMDKEYIADNYAPNRWRWIIPKEIESYPVLSQAFRMIPPVYPLAELHRLRELIYSDFTFPGALGRSVSAQAGYAWRNSAVRNYTAAKIVDLGYPFLCEIRCSFISSTPKRFYQIKERAVYDKGAMTLKQALETCVYNLLQYFFPHAKEEYEYSSMSFAEHEGTIEYTTEKVDLQRRYPRLRNVPHVTSLGEDSTEPWELTEYPYYRAIKYIRIIGKWAYKNQNFTRHIYLDEDVERVLYDIEQSRLANGFPRRIWVDPRGFVWRA